MLDAFAVNHLVYFVLSLKIEVNKFETSNDTMITTKLLIIFALFGFNKLWFHQAAIIDAHINDFDGNFNSVEIAATGNRSTNVFMQLLASQNVHKSHRFFYMLGERRPGISISTFVFVRS